MSTNTLLQQKPSISSRTLLVGLWSQLSRIRRVQFLIGLILMLVSGCAELVTLGTVLPFLAVISDPGALWQQSHVQSLAFSIGLNSPDQLVLPITIAFVVTNILVALIRLLNLWLNTRLSAEIGSDLSYETYKRTIYQPYIVHIKSNTSKIVTAITSQINLTVEALYYFLQVISSVVISIGLLVGLLIIDTQIALASAVVFSAAYLLLAALSRRELQRNSLEIAEASTNQVKALQEGLGAIRDVLMDGCQLNYLKTYQHADRHQRRLVAKNLFLGIFPRYALEGLGMVSIGLLGGALLAQRADAVTVIPLLGAMALGAQRLLPALQQIYSGWVALKARSSAIEAVLNMLSQKLPKQVNAFEPLKIRNGIIFERVCFNYNEEHKKVLNEINLEVRRGERIGLIGSTGSGKSTLVDVLIGLLEPTAGRILVDGNDIYDSCRPEQLLAWRGAIAHVPQTIYLADRSIAENIAFGVSIEKIQMDRVKQAATKANIASFIESLPKGYQSFAGERGIRLSGGQRQRIGIARALYKSAQVLVFDEATSALDNDTEESIMTAIDGLSEDFTIIMIAHRLTTVMRCDRVIRLEQGSVIAAGPPREILPNY